MKKELNTVLEKYISAGTLSCTKLNQGEINETYLIVAGDGGKYILQKIKVLPMFDRNSSGFHEIAEAWSRNYKIVNKALAGEGLISSKPLRIQGDGNHIFRSSDKSLWRMFGYIDHDKVYSVDEKSTYSAGKALGSFHRLLEKTEYVPAFPIPDFHDTPKIIKRLENVFFANKKKARIVEEEYRFLSDKIKTCYLPENLPVTVLHGDPKLDNFLFRHGEVRGIIDLDTMMIGSVYLDIGDALRNWCGEGNSFRKDIFLASLEGYQKGAERKIDPELALMSVKLITLELAARYLIDHFEETYFAWDQEKFKSAAEHNLIRARNGIEYFNNMNI